MIRENLILLSREGCCLCQGLEEKLRSVPLHDLRPSLKLRVIDIDNDEIAEPLRTRYDLQVPVMLLATNDLKNLVDDLCKRGIDPPILIRFNDILNSQVQSISKCFQNSISEYGYQGEYRGVMPIKVNQQ